MHALIIEYEALVAMAIEDALRDCGWTSFDFAVTADAAVEAARRHRPDLITADVRLAAGSGIDAIEMICADKPTAVIFITSTSAELERRLPHHVLVRKPFSAAGIAKAVRKVTLPNP